VAKGAQETGMAFFSSATRPEELIALAWYLEAGSQKFYSEMASRLKGKETGDLYLELVGAEEGHKSSLLRLYEELFGSGVESGFPGSVIAPDPGDEVMEGGVKVPDALDWAKDKEVAEIVEFSLALESNSYDLYLKMDRQVKDPRSSQVFRLLSGEEKRHLERLSSLLEKERRPIP